MAAPAACLPGDAGREPMHFSPQSSQPARGAEVWAVLATLGRDGVAQLVDRPCRLARRFADGMREAGYRVLNDVVLNQVVVDFGDPPRTGALIAARQQESTCWCGPTTRRSRKAMRVSVRGWHTSAAGIDQRTVA